jgi:hypothetical protein
LPPNLWDLAAVGHRANGRPVAGKWRVYPEMAAAGLWTTPSDLGRLALDLQRAISHEKGTLLSHDTVQQMLTPHANAGDRGRVGLGVFIERATSGIRFGHPGDNEGYTARWISLAGDEHGGRGAVVMTNSDAGWSFQDEVLEAVTDWP